MRILLLAFLCCFLSAFDSSKVQITPSFKKLQIFIPTLESFKTLNQENSLTLTFSTPLLGNPLSQSLQAPFEKLEISQNSSNQTQLILYGKNLELNTQKEKDGLLLTFTSEIIQISWGRYIAVLSFLLIALFLLLIFRKKIKAKFPTSKTKYSEIPLKARTKLITLEHQDEIYLIFCNEKGCTLLNHYPKTKDNKEFIDLIKEE